MTVFEKVTASPEALGKLLDSLTVIDSPWEEAFHRVFCDSCIDSNGTQNCDTPGCPHEAERNNPLWWLAQVVEGEQDASRAVWRNGRVEPEPGMIVPLQKEKPPANGICNEFNVYLNGKGPNGKNLRNIKKVILPKISADEEGRIEPADMKLVFGGCEDAAEIVNLLGEKCKLEIRAAVENWNYNGKVEYFMEPETMTVHVWTACPGLNETMKTAVRVPELTPPGGAAEAGVAAGVAGEKVQMSADVDMSAEVPGSEVKTQVGAVEYGENTIMAASLELHTEILGSNGGVQAAAGAKGIKVCLTSELDARRGWPCSVAYTGTSAGACGWSMGMEAVMDLRKAEYPGGTFTARAAGTTAGIYQKFVTEVSVNETLE